VQRAQKQRDEEGEEPTMTETGFLRTRWDPPPEHAPTTKGQRDIMVTIRWGAKDVTLRNPGGDGKVFMGASGEEKLMLVARRSSCGGYVARLEDTTRGNSWAGEVKRDIRVAFASLHRELKRVSRAGGLGR
jgi:hypothetical protein